MKEREISLLNLCVDILLHWRSILVVMLVGGVLMGAFESVTTEKKQMEKFADEELIREALTEEQLNAVSVAIANRQVYEAYLKYQEESTLFSLDAAAVLTAKLVFGVAAEDVEQSKNIARAYEEIITSPEAYDFLLEKCQVNGRVEELVSIAGYEKISSSVTMIGNENVGSSVTMISNENAGIIRVDIIYSDEVTCAALAEAMKEFVELKKKEIENTLGLHSVELISGSVGSVCREDILEKQKVYVEKLASLQNICQKQQAALTGDALDYFEYLMEKDELVSGEWSPSIQGTLITTKPSMNGKYVLVGMILFAFIEVFVIFICHILNNRLRATDSLQDIYLIPQLGCVEWTKKKRAFCFIDEWIVKLCYYGKRRFNTEEALEFVAVAVKMVVRNAGTDTVYLVGCNYQESSVAVCNYLRKALEKENIRINLINNIIYDAVAMEKLVEMRHAVLIESAGSTLYSEIAQELELMARHNIKVLGGVVVG